MRKVNVRTAEALFSGGGQDRMIIVAAICDVVQRTNLSSLATKGIAYPCGVGDRLGQALRRNAAFRHVLA